MVAFTTRIGKGSAVTFAEGDANLAEVDRRTGLGYRDLVSPLTVDGVPVEFAPTYQPFGPSGLRRELSFDIDDYAYSYPFHINHDILVGGKGLVHVHWSSNGTSVQPVKWEFQLSRAIGHNQAYFGAETSLFKQQASNGGAWRHMVAEVDIADAITLTEPDELILVTLRRVTNGATDNTDTIFGLLVDFHYESDRSATPNRAPNFYA
jgi:hypothetical protein